MFKIIFIISFIFISMVSESDAGTAPPYGPPVSETGYYLYQNYPNPFNDLTLIEFSIADDNIAEIYITDEEGKKIETLVDGEIDKGEHYVFFKPSDNIVQGNYICVMKVFSESGSKLIHSEKIKMLCVKREDIIFKK